MKMRIITLLLLLIISQPLLSQKKATAKSAMSKNDIKSEMNEATDVIAKEITELEKQLKTETDEETIKDLKDQIDMLKKQLKMMQGLNNNLSKMSDKTVQEAVEENDVSASVPKRDMTRISMLPKKILTEAELVLFIKNIQDGVEKIISPAEKAEALKIYNDTKVQYKSTAVVANAASGCWMIGNWEKALFIMGKVCSDDVTDADNLNNYAAFLISAGAEHAALPILQYLNFKYPKNSTLLNNIGQAWFGLGEMEIAKKYLDSATMLYPHHSTANSTMSKIYESEGKTDKSIAFLKASLKETYDPEKEAELLRLGYKIKYADLPDFNYPMKRDPLGFIRFVESIPEKYPARIGDDATVDAINSYVLGVRDLSTQLNDENVELQNELKARSNKLSSDSDFRAQFLEPHNCPAHNLAVRSFQLIWEEKMGGLSPLPTQLLLPVQNPFADINSVKTLHEIWQECQDIWTEKVVKPTADLARAWSASNEGKTCADVDAATNAYLAKKNAIREEGVKLIKQKVHGNAGPLDAWTKIALYSVKDDPPKNEGQLSMDLVSELEFTTARKSFRNGELTYVLSMAQNFVEKQAKLKSSCSNPQPTSDDPHADDLTPLIATNLKCEFRKVMSTPVVVYSFQCNTMKENLKPNAKSKKDPVNRGQGQSSKRNANTRGPLRGGKGLYSFDEDELSKNVNQKFAPLSAEDKDLSQFSIEYDRWGNLIGLNVQLNKEGVALADPDSEDTGMDSRWSWNAIASFKKGFLHNLLIK